MDINLLQNKYLTGEFKLKHEFMKMDGQRGDTLTRCEKYAGWTLPALFPEDNMNESEEMQNDYQSVGAQSVTNLANKIMMALFHPSKPFFRMNLSKEQKADVQATGMSEAQVQEALAETEREAMKELAKRSRVTLITLVKHLIITGNAMLYDPAHENPTVYSLRDYVINRDLRGEFTKIIIKETKAVTSLSDDMMALTLASGYCEDDEVSLYTCVCRTGKNRYIVWQELEDICYCHKRIGHYTKDELPWIPLTWELVRGKDYGTGLVEEYAGDFFTLSTLAEAMLDFTTVVTDVKNLVNPTGMTDVRELTQAASGAYVHGREGDIFTYTAAGEMGQAAAFLGERFDSISRRISAAFLLNSQVTRDAERVTAEEIRLQAQELESSLGGVYSRLAAELQLPLARNLLRRMDRTFKEVEPTIVTGFESLSRNSELDNIRAMMTDLANMAALPDEAKMWINMPDMIAVLGAGHGVDYKKFLKDEDKVKSDMQQAAELQAAQAGMEAGAVSQAEQGNQQ